MKTTSLRNGATRLAGTGEGLARADIKNLLYLLVDVVIQFGIERHQRFIKEIFYDPERKRRSLASAR